MAGPQDPFSASITQLPVASIEPPRRADGALLHFLKELPAWVILGIFVVAFLTVWQLSHDDFIPRIIDGLVGALLTSIIAQRPRPTTATISPPSTLSTDTMEVDSKETNINVKEGQI